MESVCEGSALRLRHVSVMIPFAVFFDAMTFHACSHSRRGVTSHKDERDPETFDDGEFYQQLLKEFLEYSGNAGNGLATVRPAKKRKLVDRKASKGRKIRCVACSAPLQMSAHTITRTEWGTHARRVRYGKP